MLQHISMYVYVYIYECMCVSICVYVDGFISFKIMHFYCILFFLYFLNEKFQLCTKMRDSKVYTSASTFF